MRVDYQDASGDTIYTQYVKVSEGLTAGAGHVAKRSALP